MKVIPLGDSGVVIRLRESLSQPEETLAEVLATIEALRVANLPGVTEITPAFTSIGVFFEPAAVGVELPTEWLSARITAIATEKTKKAAVKNKSPRTFELPVCYEDEFAPDLSLVAQHTGLPVDEVIERHAAAEYRVHCVGFTPGFPYLAGLPAELATPRRATPRKQVPAGSVGIGGAQTGIYPQASPGGWNVIGRTPTRLFDPQAVPPALLQAGDRVRFRIISRQEFDR